MERKTFRLTSKVTRAFTNDTNDGGKQFSLYLELPSKAEDIINDYMIDNELLTKKTSDTPIKTGEDCMELKVSSKFTFPINGLPNGIEKEDIGPGTICTAYFHLKASRYGRKEYVVAYLTALEIQQFVEKELHNPFIDEDAFDLSGNCHTETQDLS